MVVVKGKLTAASSRVADQKNLKSGTFYIVSIMRNFIFSRLIGCSAFETVA
ncbi:unnamed protein product, partial [Vitis vinifera]|uniref:Uncharacterized protein n=1 Tax=Vitis vinifera TaxID=29760 RepID=D7TYS4_VITVI